MLVNAVRLPVHCHRVLTVQLEFTTKNCSFSKKDLVFFREIFCYYL